MLSSSILCADSGPMRGVTGSVVSTAYVSASPWAATLPVSSPVKMRSITAVVRE
jgi:hypothetical protein